MFPNVIHPVESHLINLLYMHQWVLWWFSPKVEAEIKCSFCESFVIVSQEVLIRKLTKRCSSRLWSRGSITFQAGSTPIYIKQQSFRQSGFGWGFLTGLFIDGSVKLLSPCFCPPPFFPYTYAITLLYYPSTALLWLVVDRYTPKYVANAMKEGIKQREGQIFMPILHCWSTHHFYDSSVMNAIGVQQQNRFSVHSNNWNKGGDVPYSRSLFLSFPMVSFKKRLLFRSKLLEESDVLSYHFKEQCKLQQQINSTLPSSKSLHDRPSVRVKANGVIVLHKHHHTSLPLDWVPTIISENYHSDEDDESEDDGLHGDNEIVPSLIQDSDSVVSFLGTDEISPDPFLSAPPRRQPYSLARKYHSQPILPRSPVDLPRKAGTAQVLMEDMKHLQQEGWWIEKQYQQLLYNRMKWLLWQ